MIAYFKKIGFVVWKRTQRPVWRHQQRIWANLGKLVNWPNFRGIFPKTKINLAIFMEKRSKILKKLVPLPRNYCKWLLWLAFSIFLNDFSAIFTQYLQEEKNEEQKSIFICLSCTIVNKTVRASMWNAFIR